MYLAPSNNLFFLSVFRLLSNRSRERHVGFQINNLIFLSVFRLFDYLMVLNTDIVKFEI